MRHLTPLSWKYKAVVTGGVAALVLCAVSAVFGSGGVVHLYRLHAQQLQIEATAFALSQRNARIREHLERIEHDDTYLEKVVRDRLGWIRPGEIVYRIDRRD